MMFWFGLSLKSPIPVICQSSISWLWLLPTVWNSTPCAQGISLHVRESFRPYRQRKLECFCRESIEFRICSRINNFYVHAFYCNPGHDGSLYDYFLDSMARVQSVDDKAVFVFVGDDKKDMGVMILIFAIRQVVSSWCAVPLTLLLMGLDLVIADVPDFGCRDSSR